MANKHFIVHNGLTVGPLTIDAVTGDLTTSGNVNITGNLGVSQIAKNDSSVTINDTGAASNVLVVIDGTTRANVHAGGLTVVGNISALDITGTLLTASQTNITQVGTLGTLTVSGNTEIGSRIYVNSANATVGIGNSSPSSSYSLSVSGEIFSAISVNIAETTSATSTSTGALKVSGGIGVAGNAYIGNSLFISGVAAATVDDVTALAIALG